MKLNGSRLSPCAYAALQLASLRQQLTYKWRSEDIPDSWTGCHPGSSRSVVFDLTGLGWLSIISFGARKKR